MDIVNKKCPICGSPLKSSKDLDDYDIYEYNCYRCGKFKITEEATGDQCRYLTNQQCVNISGWIRENQGSDIVIDEERLKSLLSLPELTMFEKADKMLQYLAKNFPVAGSYLTYRFNEVFGILEIVDKKTFLEEGMGNSREFYINITYLLPLISIGRIIDRYEFEFIWKKYIIDKKKYISQNHSVTMITPIGWAYLETFRHPNPDSKKAFVAMWFNEEMEEILKKYIKPAAKEAGGYKAESIDEKDYNGDINDAIIGEIRSSKFVIADFTGNRGGVYYEAGFAYGLNIPVIYSCKKEWFNKFVKQNIKTKDSKGNEKEINKNLYSQIHFDVNHQNFIVWKNGDDLYKKLLNKIKATIV